MYDVFWCDYYRLRNLGNGVKIRPNCIFGNFWQNFADFSAHGDHTGKIHTYFESANQDGHFDAYKKSLEWPPFEFANGKILEPPLELLQMSWNFFGGS